MFYSISGNVFIDSNKNELKDPGESNYQYPIDITAQGGSANYSATYPAPGQYAVANLTAGTYTVTYTDPPGGAAGYEVTVPQDGIQPFFQVAVGPGCSSGASPQATCNAGNISNLNFGITNSIPWFQGVAGDMRIDTGYVDQLPSAQPQFDASLPGPGGTPGVIFSGNGLPGFGKGVASATNWVVGGDAEPETFTPINAGVMRTSYAYVLATAQDNVIPMMDMGQASVCGGGRIASCVLSGSLPHGLYRSNGNLTLASSSYTFAANQNFVFVVNGTLTIDGQIHVPQGSTATFIVSGDIDVSPSVGEADASSTAPDLEGFYSTDASFNTGTVNTGGGCSPDKRLNLAGSVVANAGLSGGKVDNQRDLCGGDPSYPSFYLQERPDFYLNAPSMLRHQPSVWQEVAPSAP